MKKIVLFSTSLLMGFQSYAFEDEPAQCFVEGYRYSCESVSGEHSFRYDTSKYGQFEMAIQLRVDGDDSILDQAEYVDGENGYLHAYSWSAGRVDFGSSPLDMLLTLEGREPIPLETNCIKSEIKECE